MEPNYYPNSNGILGLGILGILHVSFGYFIYIMFRVANLERVLFLLGC